MRVNSRVVSPIDSLSLSPARARAFYLSCGFRYVHTYSTPTLFGEQIII